MDFTELMSDREIINGAYELAVLLQFACEHKGLEPTAANMADVHAGMREEQPLDRATALEYAAYLIEDEAAEAKGGDLEEGEKEAIEAALRSDGNSK